MASTTLEQLGITPEKITAYDQRIPRYTSYPTAPIWQPAFGPAEWRSHLAGTRESRGDLSLYVHIPFCGKRCLFCACNVIVTRKEGVASEYLDVLEKEVALYDGLHSPDRRVVQLHLGGGTPNFLSSEEMARLIRLLEKHFTFSPLAERSIEVDPRIATPEQIEFLYNEGGFRRISFGVQDFHEETQLAIGRGQTLEVTFDNAAAARQTGFRSVNIDLIYGLPMQTEKSWSETLDSVCRLRPDRIALYNFAFLPTKLANQRAVEEEMLPSPGQKLEMFAEAHNRLTAEGWVFIGMDHYALADDSLTRAQAEGSLRRNFMGYTTLRGVDMLAFGVSSISDYHFAFAQNVKKLSEHRRMIEAGELPVERGMLLSIDDRLRRNAIEELMCNGRLIYNDDAGVPGERMGRLVEEAMDGLKLLEQDGLIVVGEDALRVTDKGRIFLRNIAVLFDAYIKGTGPKHLYSRAV